MTSLLGKGCLYLLLKHAPFHWLPSIFPRHHVNEERFDHWLNVGVSHILNVSLHRFLNLYWSATFQLYISAIPLRTRNQLWYWNARLLTIMTKAYDRSSEYSAELWTSVSATVLMCFSDRPQPVVTHVKKAIIYLNCCMIDFAHLT